MAEVEKWEKHPLKPEKLNYIVSYIMDACDAPVQIYIQTLWPALLEALISYYAIDLIQIFTGWVRPHNALKRVRGGGHGRSRRDRWVKDDRKPRPKGRKRTWVRRWRAWVGFDPWDWIGRHMPGAGMLSARSVSPGVVTLWTIYDLGQRLAYWVMVYEITEEFFYKWLSGVAESRYCQEQYRPWCFCTAERLSNFGVLGYGPATIDEVVKSRRTIYSAGNVIKVEGGGSSAILSAVVHNDNGNDLSEYECYLSIKHETGAVFHSSRITHIGQSVSVQGQVTTEGRWEFFTTGEVSFSMESAEFTVLGTDGHYNP